MADTYAANRVGNDFFKKRGAVPRRNVAATPGTETKSLHPAITPEQVSQLPAEKRPALDSKVETVAIKKPQRATFLTSTADADLNIRVACANLKALLPLVSSKLADEAYDEFRGDLILSEEICADALAKLGVVAPEDVDKAMPLILPAVSKQVATLRYELGTELTPRMKDGLAEMMALAGSRYQKKLESDYAPTPEDSIELRRTLANALGAVSTEILLFRFGESFKDDLDFAAKEIIRCTTKLLPQLVPQEASTESAKIMLQSMLTQAGSLFATVWRRTGDHALQEIDRRTQAGENRKTVINDIRATAGRRQQIAIKFEECFSAAIEITAEIIRSDDLSVEKTRKPRRLSTKIGRAR